MKITGLKFLYYFRTKKLCTRHDVGIRSIQMFKCLHKTDQAYVLVLSNTFYVVKTKNICSDFRFKKFQRKTCSFIHSK